jgi:hypothetical protein
LVARAVVVDSAALVARVPVPAGPVVLAQQLVPAPVPVPVRWQQVVLAQVRPEPGVLAQVPVVLAHRVLDPAAPVQPLPSRQSCSAAMAKTTT